MSDTGTSGSGTGGGGGSGSGGSGRSRGRAPRPPGFLLVSACYQAFTLSDGALRMLVLLHLHAEGQTAWALALVLLPYELAGVATNLLGGYLGARFGLKHTLTLGLGMQAVACALLTVETSGLTLGYVMATQVLSGVAKDLAKTSAKSYVRLLASPAPRGGGAGASSSGGGGQSLRLFGLVAWLTGSKNAMKGLGFFVGGILLTSVGFAHTNAALAALLAATCVAAFWRLPKQAASARRGSFRQLLAHDRATNWLSAARLFLFGSRDAWFAIALPLFLVDQGWSPATVGAYLSLWIIGYGFVQACAPNLLNGGRGKASRAEAAPDVGSDQRCGAAATARYTGFLLAPLGLTAAAVHWLPEHAVVAALLVGLAAYGAVFAITSSLHSWLIVALHDDDSHRHIAERVGFYYAANALGRLVGVAASGWLYASFVRPREGLTACLMASIAAVVLATACSGRMRFIAASSGGAR
ncbi:MAG: MFS transporter [Planctomycetota bacterium]